MKYLWLLLLVGCTATEATEPPVHEAAAQTADIRFTYTHEAGCPVTLLVWFWNDGQASKPLLWTNLSESVIAGASPADSVQWRLNVLNNEAVGFTISGWGNARFNQPGGCF